MKTGRVRKKEKATKPPSTQQPTTPGAVTSGLASGPAVSPAPGLAAGQAPKPANGKIVAGVLIGLFACFALVMILFTALGGRKADDWVPVTDARGQWTATVKIWGPRATREERWEADCRSAPQATVQPGTCILKDAQQYHDQVVDDYEEYAYNIYYEETYKQVYQAQGTEFVVTKLGTDDWWEENRHYVLEEELDIGTCEYTRYTTWVDDPDETTQEIEVYLSECEVWDHVTVNERIYEQGNWCGCDVIAVVEVGQEVQQGEGTSVRWPNPVVLAGGRTERAFRGTVTFQGDDHTYTATTGDLATYQDYLTGEYYIGLADGKPIRVSKNRE
ncbi:MAG TPA: hypothetical protein VLC52_10385 [Anaerolineae bacterium]|nr:hypothetical protein [Anaerolineae bacterium]